MKGIFHFEMKRRNDREDPLSAPAVEIPSVRTRTYHKKQRMGWNTLELGWSKVHVFTVVAPY